MVLESWYPSIHSVGTDSLGLLRSLGIPLLDLTEPKYGRFALWTQTPGNQRPEQLRK